MAKGKGKGKTQAAQAGKPKVAEKKEVYKDPYSSKEYESKEAFLAMKLAHTKTNFTKLHNALLAAVNSGKKEVTVDIKVAGLETMDERLPRYVLGFIKGGKEYKTKHEAKAWNKLTLTKK